MGRSIGIVRKLCAKLRPELPCKEDIGVKNQALKSKISFF
jgi:hypothetical protein